MMTRDWFLTETPASAWQARAGRWAEAERTLSRSYELDPANPVRSLALGGTGQAWVNDGQTLSLGGTAVTFYLTPGHSPGHLCFWEATNRLMLTEGLAEVPPTPPGVRTEERRDGPLDAMG